MTDRLKGKVAFITGAASGIGRAAAQLFAQEGAQIAVADISSDEGEETAKLINSIGGDAFFVETDVTNPQTVQNAIKVTIDRYGHLDILYNNAGGSRIDDGMVTDVSIDIWEKTISLDLFGTFLCCKYGIPELINSGGGSIINTSSYLALVGQTKRAAYTAAKGGIISMSRMMAVHYAKNKIRVNVICPGTVLTERVKTRQLDDPDMYSGREKESLLGFLDPKDIAHAALYLASDESRRVTGVVLPVDSGATAQ